MRTIVAAALLLAAFGCSPSRPPDPPAAAPPNRGKPYVDTTLILPPCAASATCAHVLVVPTGYLESTRCIVAIGPSGNAAVSCAPKDIDLPQENASP